MATMPLREVDKVEILTVLDNTIDLLMASSPQVKRLPLPPDALTRESLVAEHGFAALVSVTSGDTSESLLFDAGLSKNGLMHNMDVLEVRPKELHTIVLSHGHADHIQGLMGMVERLGERKMPLLLHPDAFLERKLLFPDGHEIHLPPPDRRLLSHEGIEVIALFEPITPPTIAALKELSPALIVPAHCTGWKATHALARELPEAFVPNSVGTRFML